MSTQYDDMGYLFTKRREAPKYMIEKGVIKKILQPYITGARVLELACGSGFYTYDLMDWGAESVVGVDISSEMIEAARKCPARDRHGSAVTFMAADASEPVEYPGGPFDIVLGVWLLNYAPDRQTMTRMFENAALNLQSGGMFVALQNPPAEDPASCFTEGMVSLGFPKLIMEMQHEVEDGVKLRVHVGNNMGDGSFECYYLKKAVYEASARAAGMTGSLEWIVTKKLDHHEMVHREDSTPEQKHIIDSLAHHYFGVLVVFK